MSNKTNQNSKNCPNLKSLSDNLAENEAVFFLLFAIQKIEDGFFFTLNSIQVEYNRKSSRTSKF